jgi:hypothetical protein
VKRGLVKRDGPARSRSTHYKLGLFARIRAEKISGLLKRLKGARPGKSDWEEIECKLGPMKRSYNKLAPEESILEKRIFDLEKLKRAYEAGEASEVINAGDQHGSAQDLERILLYAKEAAQKSKEVEIVIHGDVFDGRSENVRNFEILKELKELEQEAPHITVKLLLGNHELVIIQSILLHDRNTRVD